MATFRSVEAVASFLVSLPASPHHLLVGVTGAPGAGKSTIAEELVRRLPSAALLPMDGYHLPQAELRRLGRRERMGAPDTFDVDGFLLTLRDLQVGGGPVFAPGFNREIEEPVPDTIAIQPEQQVVVIEGNYLLLESAGWEAAACAFDLTFFVELDDKTRLKRLVDRHVRFGKSPADARAWALGPDEANARLIAATAGRATHRIALG